MGAYQKEGAKSRKKYTHNIKEGVIGVCGRGLGGVQTLFRGRRG